MVQLANLRNKLSCFITPIRRLKRLLFGNPADGCDYSKIPLMEKTNYELRCPQVDECDYSTGVPPLIQFAITFGWVRFGLEYDKEAEKLDITIFEAINLPAADEGGSSDPYVRVMLLPDTRTRFETIVIDDCLDPVYDQSFTFIISMSELMNRTLCIRALDYDQQPRHDILGECLLKMVDIDLSEPAELWRILVPAYDMENPGELRQSFSELGDICVAMRYSPPKRKLFIYVIECKNLKSVDEGGLSDPFVKVNIMRNGKAVKSVKTRHIKQTLDPYYNEEFVITLDPQYIPITDVRFVVADYDMFGAADIIGEVSIGSNTYGPQLRHWRDMTLAYRKTIACWHMLGPKSN